MNGISLAIVGATGAVGRKFLEVIEERNVPISKLVLFASNHSAGKVIKFKGLEYLVLELNEENLIDNKVSYALFSAGANVSKTFAPLFVANGTIVIDNSSAWRMDETVPLVVPEVNPGDAYGHQGIIANPNCSTIQAVVALKPIHDIFPIKRVVISTYQAVSGAGQAGIADLVNATTNKFPYPINGNVIPHIDVFLADGNTKEEDKMIREMRKIMHLPHLKVSATAVRVPVYNGHSESINVEFEKDYQLDQIRAALAQAPGIIVKDNPTYNDYPMPVFASGHDEVFVGRLRNDASLEHGINMFVVADNIRKGAATNAVQILELLVQEIR